MEQPGASARPLGRGEALARPCRRRHRKASRRSQVDRAAFNEKEKILPLQNQAERPSSVPVSSIGAAVPGDAEDPREDRGLPGRRAELPVRAKAKALRVLKRRVLKCERCESPLCSEGDYRTEAGSSWRRLHSWVRCQSLLRAESGVRERVRERDACFYLGIYIKLESFLMRVFSAWAQVRVSGALSFWKWRAWELERIFSALCCGGPLRAFRRGEHAVTGSYDKSALDTHFYWRPCRARQEDF